MRNVNPSPVFNVIIAPLLEVTKNEQLGYKLFALCRRTKTIRFCASLRFWRRYSPPALRWRVVHRTDCRRAL